MYGQGGLGPSGSTVTGAGGAVSILGGAAVLPNTSGDPFLMILAAVTIVLGVAVVTSFFVSRYIVARSK